ncbi:MAG: cupredoxin domain-containing protein [Solirubrobacteraceae bacterium]
MNLQPLLRRPTILIAPLVAAIIVAAAGLALRTGTPNAGPAKVVAAGPAAVAIKNYLFAPAKLTVKVGTRVTFTNSDSTPHTATADAGGTFDTGSIATGQAKPVSFNKSGTFTYHCAFHAFMTGVVTVN